MWCDVQNLHKFYLSAQGVMTQTILSRHLNELWPNVHGLTVGAYGYPLPYVCTFVQEAQTLMLFMPAPMGATPWPALDHNKVILCAENLLPLKDKSLDRLLIVHALESTENTRALLRECWRVLADGGEIIIAAPNRRGIWARSSLTPFGQGQPYTGRQLFDLLQENMFSPQKPTYTLFPPPKGKLPYHLYQKIETYGSRWCKKLGGVVVIQAQKRLLAGLPTLAPSWSQRIFIPQGWGHEA